MSNVDAIAFVKRLTTVPERFVDELFGLYDPQTTTQRDHVLLLDNIATWLDAQKYILHRTLKRSYIKGVDYIVEKAPNPNRKPGSRGANNYTRILVTPDCFKRLCMLSHTKKAELVRSYFIDVETQFLRYRGQLMDGLKRDVQRLERDLNPKRLPPASASPGGYLYVIHASEEADELFKRGRAMDLKRSLLSFRPEAARRARLYKTGSTGDPQQRMRGYQTGHAHEVLPVFIYAVQDMRSAERCVKAHLREFQYRARREVYQVPLDMLKDVIVQCDAIDGAKREYVRRRALVPQVGGGRFYAVFGKELVLP